MARHRHIWILLALAAAAFAADQGSKAWVVAAFDPQPGELIDVLPVLNFTASLNRGVNFGIGASDSAAQQYALAGLAAAVSIALVVWSIRARRAALSLGAGLVIGGALANALDRLRLGGVFDFINMDCCGIGNPYVFNLADVAIFAGALVIALFGWSPAPQRESADPGA